MEKEKERVSKHTHSRICARHHRPSEFTRGINYVQTVGANIITDVLAFLTGHSRELLIATRHRLCMRFNLGERRETR